MLGYPNDFVSFSESLSLAQEDKNNIFISLVSERKNDAIPFAVKDNICTLTTPTTCASRILNGYVSPYEATVLTKLKKYNCSEIGKTNLDEFAMGTSSETSCYGPCLNPWDSTRVCGGSSGGSAASVAADIVPFALGSDTGGSVRHPASFCGVFGFRPTWGRVSRYGLISMASSMDVVGVFSKTLNEVRWVFDAIKGFDRNDSTSYDVKKNVVLRAEKPKKVFVPRLKDLTEIVEPYILEDFEILIKDITKENINVHEVDCNIFENSLPVYYLICYAEVSSNLSRFDGIRFGPKNNSHPELLRKESFGQEVQRRILMGCHVLSEGHKEGLYEKAVYLRRHLSSTLNSWSKDGLLLTPTTPSVAFEINSKKDPIAMYRQDFFTTAPSLAGVPAINIPWNKHKGLPYGFQVSSGVDMDENLINEALWINNFSKWTR